MATLTEKTTIRTKLALYEGTIEHMYLDTEGFVTVGVGHLLKDVSAGQKLEFIRYKDNKKATKDEIKTDFDAIKKQLKGLYAFTYKKHAKLKLKTVTIDGLTDKHIESFEKELKTLYGSAEFNAFPSEVRLALFDLIFNLGMTKLKAQFVVFNKKIKAKDWKEAANQSSRTGIGADRNKYVKDLLLKAAKASATVKP